MSQLLEEEKKIGWVIPERMLFVTGRNFIGDWDSIFEFMFAPLWIPSALLLALFLLEGTAFCKILVLPNILLPKLYFKAGFGVRKSSDQDIKESVMLMKMK